MRLAEKIKVSSIKKIPILSIHVANEGFRYPLENVLTYSQRNIYNDLGSRNNLNIPVRDQSCCGSVMCTSTEIKICQTKIEDEPLEIKMCHPTPEIKV